MALDKKQILNAVDLPTIKVDVPEWKGHVYLRTMSIAQRDYMESLYLQLNYAIKNGGDTSEINIRARTVCYCICDESGKRIFEDSEAEALGEKSAKVIDMLVEKCQELNGISDDDLEAMEKNSGSGTLED